MSVKTELPTYGYRCTHQPSSCRLASRVLVLASAIMADVSSDDQWSRWMKMVIITYWFCVDFVKVSSIHTALYNECIV